MPVRSSNSSVVIWPDRSVVDRAVRRWAAKAATRLEVVRIGYFGSYARGDWGPGSDLDLIVVVESSQVPFNRRTVDWDTAELPVPTDVLVYTLEEWRRLDPDSRFAATLQNETVWVFERE